MPLMAWDEKSITVILKKGGMGTRVPRTPIDHGNHLKLPLPFCMAGWAEPDHEPESRQTLPEEPTPAPEPSGSSSLSLFFLLLVLGELQAFIICWVEEAYQCFSCSAVVGTGKSSLLPVRKFTGQVNTAAGSASSGSGLRIWLSAF